MGILLFTTVKTISTRGLSAWIKKFSTINPSETTCETLSKDENWFEQWLVGIIDGDGSFTFTGTNGKWNLEFKVGQSSYNLRLLYYIKSMIGVGTVYVPKNGRTARYRLRNVEHIVLYLIPILDKYPLLTSKYYNYDLFKQAALILYNKNLTDKEKDAKLSILNTQKSMPNNYISPRWRIVNNIVSSKTDASIVMCKPWLVGFTEAEGSFFIGKKGGNRYVHYFVITQKLDKMVLIAISQILEIPFNVHKIYFAVETSKSSRIINIINYYTKTMKGMKSLEFRIWSRSFKKREKYPASERYVYLAKIQDQMRNIRSIRMNENYSITHHKFKSSK